MRRLVRRHLLWRRTVTKVSERVVVNATEALTEVDPSYLLRGRPAKPPARWPFERPSAGERRANQGSQLRAPNAVLRQDAQGRHVVQGLSRR